MNDASIVDYIKVFLTVSGSIGAAWVTARLARRSQAESIRVEEANGIAERYSKLTNDIVEQKNEAVLEAKHRNRQISLWRRYAHDLRAQIYSVGGTPTVAPDELEI